MSAARPSTDPTRPTELLGIAVRGFAMGAADIVPGVSGGTMAFILGIYEQLVDSIALFTRRETLTLLIERRWRELFERIPWRFLGALAVGLLTAVFTLARGLEWTLEHHPVRLWAFFFGLVLASVIAISRHIKWSLPLLASAALSAVAAWLIVGLVPTQTPETWWFLVLSGAIAICAMILPGISGSFILVVLGKYEYVLSAVNDRDLLTLGLVAVGAGLGLLTFARLISYLFDRHHAVMVASLTGLMLGSLRKVWPWKETLETRLDSQGELVPLIERNIMPEAFGPEVMLAVALAVFGFVAVTIMDRAATRVGG